MMNRLAAFLLLALLFATPALAAKPQAGDTLPDLEIKAAPQPAEAAYLGLPAGAKSFRLSQIKAQALMVQVFSMYCPLCQAEAPALNSVFERLKASPQGQQLKFLAIGAGNSDYEVNFFRKKYQSPLPIFPDGDYALLKLFKITGTPSYFVLKAAPGGKGFSVLYFREGRFEDEAAFYDEILNAAKLR